MMSKEEYAKISRSMSIINEIDKSLVDMYNFMSGTTYKKNNLGLRSSMNALSTIINKNRILMNVLCESQHNCITFSTSENIIGICLSDKMRKIFEENGYKSADEIAYYINCKLLEEATRYIGSENDKKGSEKLSDVPRINHIVASNNNAAVGNPSYYTPYNPNFSMDYWNQYMRSMGMGEGNKKAHQQNTPNPMNPEDMKKDVADKFKKNREAFKNEGKKNEETEEKKMPGCFNF